MGIILSTLDLINRLKIPHGDIYITGLIDEETNASGAKALALEDMKGDLAFVIDGIGTDEVIYGGADIYAWKVKVGHKENDSETLKAANHAVLKALMSVQYDDQSYFNRDKNTRFVVTALHSEQSDYIVHDESRAVADVAHIVFSVKKSAVLNPKDFADHLKQKTDVLAVKGAKIDFSSLVEEDLIQIKVRFQGKSTHPALQNGQDALGYLVTWVKDLGFDGENIEVFAEKMPIHIQQLTAGILTAENFMDMEKEPEPIWENHVWLKGQMRPLDLTTSDAQFKSWGKALSDACSAQGITCTTEHKFLNGFKPSIGHSVVRVVRQAYRDLGYKQPKVAGHFGATNANILYSKRGAMAVSGTGARLLHTTSEYLDVADYLKSIELLTTMVLLSSEYERVDD